MSSATGYLITAHYEYHDGQTETDRWVHKNEEDAEHDAEVIGTGVNVAEISVEPIEIYLGEDDSWEITR